MRKLTKYLIGILFGTFVLGTTAFAAEVTPVSGVGFTTENTEVRAEASVTGALILTKEQCPDNIGVSITGVTDNGFWEVDLGQEQKFYIEGAGLVNVTGSGNAVAAEETKRAPRTIIVDNKVIDELADYYNYFAGHRPDIYTVPIDELYELFRHYNEACRYPNEVEIQQLRECYNIYVQAVSKFLNGTVDVTYYSDDSVEAYPLSVTETVGAYFQETYPRFVVESESKGLAYAECYWTTLHLNWEG